MFTIFISSDARALELRGKKPEHHAVVVDNNSSGEISFLDFTDSVFNDIYLLSNPNKENIIYYNNLWKEI